MKKESLDIMLKLLKPASRERIAEVARARTRSTKGEQLTLADAGLEEEVRGFVARRPARQVSAG